MHRHVIVLLSAIALFAAGSLTVAAHAGPLDAAAISATASSPTMAPASAPTAAVPLSAGSLSSPFSGIHSAPTPVVAQPAPLARPAQLAQPAAAAPAK